MLGLFSERALPYALDRDYRTMPTLKEMVLSSIEKLNEDAEQVAADIKAVYDEAKSAGFDVKYVKKMVALRKLDQDEIEEADELTQMYRTAIGL